MANSTRCRDSIVFRGPKGSERRFTISARASEHRLSRGFRSEPNKLEVDTGNVQTILDLRQKLGANSPRFLELWASAPPGRSLFASLMGFSHCSFVLLLILLIQGCSTNRIATALTVTSAQGALVQYLRDHPNVFASPGRTETPDEFLATPPGNVTAGTVILGMFNVDLDRRQYHLSHWYGKPGSGWFEHWRWNGAFVVNNRGIWVATKPEFRKEWGK